MILVQLLMTELFVCSLYAVQSERSCWWLFLQPFQLVQYPAKYIQLQVTNMYAVLQKPIVEVKEAVGICSDSHFN
jgi:hypothetical protein